MASRKHVRNVKAMEIAMRSQKTCNGLQKFGNGVWWIPVRFKFVTPDAADPALITAYANICNKINIAYYYCIKFLRNPLRHFRKEEPRVNTWSAAKMSHAWFLEGMWGDLRIILDTLMSNWSKEWSATAAQTQTTYLHKNKHHITQPPHPLIQIALLLINPIINFITIFFYLYVTSSPKTWCNKDWWIYTSPNKLFELTWCLFLLNLLPRIMNELTKFVTIIINSRLEKKKRKSNHL